MRSALSALHRPEHTGPRRCWPCTLANGVLLAFAVVAVARTRRRTLAVTLAAIGTALIALRGYLVPYTPQFAPRLARGLPSDPFDIENPSVPRPPEPPVSSDAPVAPGAPETNDGLDTHGGPEISHSLAEDGLDGETVLMALLDAGVLVADDETLTLADETREHWRAEMRSLRELGTDALATVVRETAPTAAVTTVEDDGHRWVVLTDETGSSGPGAWLSWPVAIAETAAVRALAGELDPETRIEAARPLRMFLEICPVCGGPVSETTTVECCGGLTTPTIGPQDVLACEACNEWLFTFPPEEP